MSGARNTDGPQIPLPINHKHPNVLKHNLFSAFFLDVFSTLLDVKDEALAASWWLLLDTWGTNDWRSTCDY